MNGGDFEAALDQLAHHGGDFLLEQDEVAHHHRASMRRLERGPAAERERRLDGDTVYRDAQIGARQSIPVNAPLHSGGLAERGIHFLPIDVLSAGHAGKRQCKGGYQKRKQTAHCHVSFIWPASSRASPPPTHHSNIRETADRPFSSESRP